jgi:hypothetical protein
MYLFGIQHIYENDFMKFTYYLFKYYIKLFNQKILIYHISSINTLYIIFIRFFIIYNIKVNFLGSQIKKYPNDQFNN